MAKLPDDREPNTIGDQIRDRVYSAWEANAGPEYYSLGANASDLNIECIRAKYYDIRWVNKLEKKDGRILRLLDTGKREEDRIADDLRRAGIEVWTVASDGRQFPARLLGGWVRGKLDLVARGFDHAPDQPFVVEAKSHNAKNFNKLEKYGVRKAKPEHELQLRSYMRAYSMPGIYAAVCKDDDRVYYEVLGDDNSVLETALSRVRAAIVAFEPPAKLNENPDDKGAFLCKFCRSLDICHKGEMPAGRSCRSCAHSTFRIDENAQLPTVECTKFMKPLTIDEQRAGCEAHLYDPNLIPHANAKYREDSETMEYTLADGRIGIDGVNVKANPGLYFPEDPNACPF
jgi:hypothetical protein